MGAEKKKLLLGTRKGLIVYKKTSSRWRFEGDHFLGIPVSIVAADQRNGNWWAMLDHGHWGCKLHRSPDQGRTWKEIEAPKYPEGEVIKDNIPATLKYLWAFATGGTDQKDRIYIGTEPGGLFSSDDNGASFTLNRALWDQPQRKEKWFGGGRDNPGIHSIVVDPADSNHAYIGISCAGVFETTDAGQTWSPRNKGLRADFLPDPNAEIGHDPHRLVACAKEPLKMWQQNHCGIFRTIDGGANWMDVSQNNGPARFGFAIAVDSNDGEVAWVIPALKDESRVPIDLALKVCRTDDGGKSWKVFDKGLPQTNCYDLVYRHALAIDGDTLAFGSTNGNLYLSEDRGESWLCLNSNLPMIYSCQFA
ncbi:MAG: exo-alpha-sialidase [Gammaproteobacteria bacterium]|nr:exo-alpha-sialidase [Gammaproteobacteria bacterium]